jgi:hypothetical protein
VPLVEGSSFTGFLSTQLHIEYLKDMTEQEIICIVEEYKQSTTATITYRDEMK